MTRGGRVHEVGVIPAATRTRGAAFRYVCFDPTEAERREDLPAEEVQNLGPPVFYLEPTEYQGAGCFSDGESSVFFLFNLWPVTPPLDPDYAISLAVQRLRGDTMINMVFWHEVHYYSLLGSAFVFHVRGNVIKFASPGAEDVDAP